MIPRRPDTWLGADLAPAGFDGSLMQPYSPGPTGAWKGMTSLPQLAAALTERGIPTSRGAERWLPTQVARVLKAAAYGT